jgi:hypothetical protein
MNDPTAVCYHPWAREDENGKRRPWPTLRLRALEKRSKPDPALVQAVTWDDLILARRKDTKGEEPRTPLEILSRMAGGSTFREPSVGRSTRGYATTTLDIAAALGYVRDPLEQRLALALACQTDAEWPAVRQLATPPMMRQLLGSHATKSLVRGKLRYRASVVLHEAFHDLALVRHPQPVPEAAKQLDVSPRDYRALYRVVAGFIETTAQSGARSAVEALFNW